MHVPLGQSVRNKCDFVPFMLPRTARIPWRDATGMEQPSAEPIYALKSTFYCRSSWRTLTLKAYHSRPLGKRGRQL
jgi:hypothetical protein